MNYLVVFDYRCTRTTTVEAENEDDLYEKLKEKMISLGINPDRLDSYTPIKKQI